MKNHLCLGADVGGTHMRTALVADDGRIVHQRKTFTTADGEPRETSRKLILECRSLVGTAAEAGHDVRAVGLGVAGKVDCTHGLVLFSPHLPKMRNYPLAVELQNALGVPVFMENDANVFGIGEGWLGAGMGVRNWLGLTLGTGVGGCLILGGKLWRGEGLGFAGEIGHMVVQSGGLPCACGLKGCLEAYSSASALVEGVMSAFSEGEHLTDPLRSLCSRGELDAEAVYHSAKQGNPLAQKLFNRMGRKLGLAIANVFAVLGINRAIIGGGVSAGWDQFIDPLETSLAEHSCMLAPIELFVQRGALGDAAPLLGAARLAWERCRQPWTQNP